ncbi:MAG: cytochrome c [Verrucomicrobia bacterium]|nr:cytochrome c [Verrucomicrobiota bacterium]
MNSVLLRFAVCSCLLVTLLPAAQSQTALENATRDRTYKPTRSLPPATWDAETERLFTADPFKIVRGERPRGGAAGAPTGPNVDPDGPPGPTNGSFAWSAIISADTVTDEIKSRLPELAQNVQTAGAFRDGGNRNVRVQYAVIAVMFGITAEYDVSIRWQNVAGGARAAFARAASNAKAADSNTYKESKLRFQDLDEMVRGGTVEFEAPEGEFVWSDVAERRALMKRLEEAHQKRLRPLTANETEFDKNRTQVIHEAEIIAALAQVIQREGYEYHDDDDYLAFCRQLQQQARGVVEAAKGKNLAEVQKHVGEISKSCSACHEGYK